MRPVAIFRFSRGDEPGRFAQWLDARHRPWRLFSLHDGEPVPTDPAAFAGLGLMGGPMSVNDALPWNAPMQALLRAAVGQRVPVIGHCLGGQLLARALGASVGPAKTAEIGWVDVEVCGGDAAREWFGGQRRFTMFEWHYEAFELPPGARCILTNAFNDNQGFVLDGLHVGFQGHVEMTAELVRLWIELSGDELPASSAPSMQTSGDILDGLEARVAALNAVADAVYARWATNLGA